MTEVTVKESRRPYVVYENFEYKEKERRFMKSMSAVKGLVVLALALTLTSTGQGQSVTFDMRFPNYDVLYLSDFVDIRGGALSSDIPEVSFRIIPASPTPFDIILRVVAFVRLRGDSRRIELVQATSDPFTLSRERSFSSRDLSASSSPDIKFKTLDRTKISAETQNLRDRLKDYVQRFPTAPVGQYTFQVKAFLAINPSQEIGGIEKTISIRNASENEVGITLVSPEQGAIVPTPFPTFSWSSEKPNVILYVYEKLPIHRSPEEAVTGIPYLKRELKGLTTFTYPADAERRLEIGKSYYWFLEMEVFTSRGTLKRSSEIRLFRVLPGGSRANALLLALSTMGGDVATQLANLIRDDWQPTAATIDGNSANAADVNALLQRLVRENADVKVSIE